MILFLFKRKKIIVDAFTSIAGVHKFYPIDKSTNKFPSWFKRLPATYDITSEYGISYKQPTIKTCSGILDLYKNSFSIPMWNDLIIQTKSDGSWVYQHSATESTPVSNHDIRQLPEINSHIHLKINSPWVFTEKTGVNFYFTDSFYDKIDKWNECKNVPAIVNYKYQHGTHINMFMPKADNTINIDAGTPIATIIPLTENDVIIKSHLLSKEEFDKLMSASLYKHSFTHYYEKSKKIVDRQSKCPMGF